MASQDLVEWVDRLRRLRAHDRRRDGCASGLCRDLQDEYVVATPKGVALLDVPRGAGSTLLWGALLFFAGLGLLGGAGWARWLAIIGVAINAIQQVAFMANYPQAYPLWNLLIVALNVIRSLRADRSLAGLPGVPSGNPRPDRGLWTRIEGGRRSPNSLDPAPGARMIGRSRLMGDLPSDEDTREGPPEVQARAHAAFSRSEKNSRALRVFVSWAP